MVVSGGTNITSHKGKQQKINSRRSKLLAGCAMDYFGLVKKGIVSPRGGLNHSRYLKTREPLLLLLSTWHDFQDQFFKKK